MEYKLHYKHESTGAVFKFRKIKNTQRYERQDGVIHTKCFLNKKYEFQMIEGVKTRYVTTVNGFNIRQREYS